MDELYERYCDGDARAQARGALLARDRDLVRSRNRLPHTRFVGLDVSRHALSYAAAAGFIDDAVLANLEEDDPTESQCEQLAATDIVISTGCLGYVSGKTISLVLAAAGERKPWMAIFGLRMFPFEPIAEELARAGYETIRIDRIFKQRRFASEEEQSLILDTLSTVGVDPRGLETEGWLYAQLYISRPSCTKAAWDHLRESLDDLADSRIRG